LVFSLKQRKEEKNVMPVNDGDARLLNIVTNSEFGSLIANPPSTLKNYVFKENITISSNIVVSDKLTFEPQDGAMFVKSGSGKITFSGIGIAAEDISPYAQVFSGFSPGDIKWGDQMPDEIYATWFGAKPVPGGMSQSATACPAGYDSLPALNVIRDSFTSQIHYNAHLPGNVPFGTAIKFPAGDFCFSAQFNFYNAFKLEGVENNNHWLRATRLLFPINSNGIFVDRYKDGFVKGRANGSFIKNLDIIPYNTNAAAESFTATFSTDAGGQKITAPAGTFAYPVIDGTMIILPGGLRGFIQRSMRSGSVNGTAYSITNNNQTITVTGAKFITDGVAVGDEVQFISLLKQVKVTQVVSEETLNVEHISNVDALGDNVGVTSGFATVSYWILDGDVAYVRSLRALATVSGTTMTMAGGFPPLPSFYNNATVNFIGNSFAPTLTTNGTTMTLSQAAPTGGLTYPHASGAHYIELSVPSGSATVQIYKYAGLRLRNFDWGIVEQVQVRGWRGSGFIVEGSLGANMGQNNMLTLRNCHSDSNNGHGYHYYGTDTHALHIEHPNSTNNVGYAHWDGSGTGISISNGHVAYNYGGIWNPIEATLTQQGNGVNQSTYNNIYFEGGLLGSRLGLHAKLDGGTNALGFHPDSQGAVTILQHHLRSGEGAGNRGARLGGAGFLAISPNFQAQHRLWGDPTPSVYPIISGGVGASVAQNGAFDWSLYNSTEGAEFGAGSGKTSGYYIAGLKNSSKSWNVKRLEIGDGTLDGNGNEQSKTSGHFVGMQAGTAAPTSGTYPLGFIVWNLNPIEGSPMGWRNIGTESSPEWEEIAISSAQYNDAFKYNYAGNNYGGNGAPDVTGWTNVGNGTLFNMNGGGAQFYNSTDSLDKSAVNSSLLPPDNVLRSAIYQFTAPGNSQTNNLTKPNNVALTSGKSYKFRYFAWFPSIAFGNGTPNFSISINGGTAKTIVGELNKVKMVEITFVAGSSNTITLTVNSAGSVTCGAQLLERV
jgi:hypothetical protein